MLLGAVHLLPLLTVVEQLAVQPTEAAPATEVQRMVQLPIGVQPTEVLADLQIREAVVADPQAIVVTAAIETSIPEALRELAPQAVLRYNVHPPALHRAVLARQVAVAVLVAAAEAVALVAVVADADKNNHDKIKLNQKTQGCFTGS